MTLTFTLKLARFLAKRLNLAGGSELEQAEVDMYGDQVCVLYFSNIFNYSIYLIYFKMKNQISDLLNEIIKALFESDEKRKETLNSKMQTETIPDNLKVNLR